MGWRALVARRQPDAPALRWLLRLYVPLQLGLLAAGGWAASQASSGWAVAGLALAVGFVTGAQGITVRP